MSLRSCLEAIGRHEKELRLCNVERPVRLREEIADYFETQNVRITTTRTASGRPADIAVLSTPDEVLTVVDASTLRGLLGDPPAGPDGVGIADSEYEPLLGHLKETTFTAYDTEQLLYASREVEDRARRTGRGRFHAGFQQFSAMAAQDPVYTDLARRGIEVHAYGVPDAPAPDFGDAQIHAAETAEIERMWFVAFDGGDDDAQKSALLAEERDEGTFYGAWTYDAALVDHVIDYLDRTYLPDDTRTPPG